MHLKCSFLYWDFSTKWVSWKAPLSVPHVATMCVSFSKPCLERLEKPSKLIHTSRNNGIDFALLTKTTMFFMCSNSSGWRKAVNSSRVAAMSPSRSAVLKRLSSLGSIFLKLCWSVASWNSSGFSANESRWSQKRSPLKHTRKTKLFESRNKKVYCQNSCCSKWKFSPPGGFKFRGQVLGLIFKDDNKGVNFWASLLSQSRIMDFAVLYIIPHRFFFYLPLQAPLSIWGRLHSQKFSSSLGINTIHTTFQFQEEQTKETWFQKVTGWLKLPQCYASATGNLTIIFSLKQWHFFRVFSGIKGMVFDIIFLIGSLNWL